MAGEFSLARTDIYIAPATGTAPTKRSDFTVIISPARILSVEWNNNLYRKDINGYIVKLDTSTVMPKKIKVDMYINSIDVAQLALLNEYYLERTRLWLIDGVCAGFRYNAGTFNLLLAADIVSLYKHLPVITAWNVYIDSISSSFYSSQKLSGEASITLEVNGVWATANCTGFYTAWDGEGVVL